MNKTSNSSVCTQPLYSFTQLFQCCVLWVHTCRCAMSLPTNTLYRSDKACIHSCTWSHTTFPSIFHHGSERSPQKASACPSKSSSSPCSTSFFQFNNFRAGWWTQCKQRAAKLWSIVFDNKVTSLFSLFNFNLGLPITRLRRQGIHFPEGYRLDSIWHCTPANESSAEFILSSKKNPEEFEDQFWVIPKSSESKAQLNQIVTKTSAAICSCRGERRPKEGGEPHRHTEVLLEGWAGFQINFLVKTLHPMLQDETCGLNPIHSAWDKERTDLTYMT